jgi:two-component system, cell cycle sensor histidine kinase and response regulator CckA
MGREPAEPARAAAASGAESVDSIFRTVFENAPTGIALVQDGRLLLVNRAVERLSGRSRTELTGLPFAELVHADDTPELERRDSRRRADDDEAQRFELRVVDASGDIHWFEVQSQPSSWQGRPAELCFFVEITERERERRETAELERLLARIAEIAPYFIFVYDYDLGRDVFINRPVAATLGYSEEDARALEPYPFVKLCHPDDYARAVDRDARWRDVREGQVDAVEFRMRHAAGEWRWFRSLNTPFLRDDDGRVRQMLGVCLDITDLKRSEEALRTRQKLESIGLVTGGVAHDFGNLLTPVLGHAELLARKLEPASPLRVNVDAIRRAAERGRDLVEQLLVVSGSEELAPRPVALDELIAESVALLAPVLPADVVLRTEVGPELPPVAGDPTQLRQVLLNLIGNARDALVGRGGTILVRALRIDVDDAQTSVLDLRERVAEGPAVLLEVEDDGPGMDVGTRTRLLEPFFTTKVNGRGLGLASVVGIVRRHRGGLAVDSNPGRGTIFRILLPLADRGVHADAVPG